jgi:hypothetical protein
MWCVRVVSHDASHDASRDASRGVSRDVSHDVSRDMDFSLIHGSCIKLLRLQPLRHSTPAAAQAPSSSLNYASHAATALPGIGV